MSRIAKNGVKLEDKVEVKQDKEKVTITGPKGSHSFLIQEGYSVEVVDGRAIVNVTSTEKEQKRKAFWGLYTRLLRNAIIGVHSGFSKKLILVGVGYRAQLKGKELVLSLGYSHPVEYPVPEGITIEVPDQTTIVISGIDKQLVGQVAAEIRSKRPPEPYKGKGVLYEINGTKEKIRMKEGKRGK